MSTDTHYVKPSVDEVLFADGSMAVNKPNICWYWHTADKSVRQQDRNCAKKSSNPLYSDQSDKWVSSCSTDILQHMMHSRKLITIFHFFHLSSNLSMIFIMNHLLSLVINGKTLENGEKAPNRTLWIRFSVMYNQRKSSWMFCIWVMCDIVEIRLPFRTLWRTMQCYSLFIYVNWELISIQPVKSS